MADLTDVIFIRSRDDLVNTEFLCPSHFLYFGLGWIAILL